MRQVLLKAPSGNEDKINAAIEKYGGKNTVSFPDQEGSAYITFLPNRRVNDLLNSLSDIGELRVSLQSSGAVALYPPQNEEPEKAADVQPKSSVDIYIEGIQSVGSWFGLLGYSFSAGIIVWVGLNTGMWHLLVAAMLVAPFAGPAMNSALATAAGRPGLLLSSLLRYGGAMLAGILASFLLTLAFPLTAYTPLMIQVSQISQIAILLPLTAGFAGAINVCQSERDSLVSGAAVGILVAASLAPPVGLLGIGLYQWDSTLIWSSIFRIFLQLLGIHLSATLVFMYYGKVSYRGVRFVKGRKIMRILPQAVVAIAVLLMMYWQLRQPPSYEKASLKTEFVEYTRQQLQGLSSLQMVDNNVSFSPNQKEGKAIVNFEVAVLRTDSLVSDSQLKSLVIKRLKTGLRAEEYDVYPVYEVRVVEE